MKSDINSSVKTPGAWGFRVTAVPHAGCSDYRAEEQRENINIAFKPCRTYKCKVAQSKMCLAN